MIYILEMTFVVNVDVCVVFSASAAMEICQATPAEKYLHMPKVAVF